MRAWGAGAVLIAACALASQAALAETWTKDAAGSAHHAQSRLICPARLVTTGGHPTRNDFAAVRLQTVIEGSADEAGCEYEGYGGPWATVEFARLGSANSYSSRKDLTRDRIKGRYPNLMRSASLARVSPVSPTGGQTYATAYYNVTVGDRSGAIAVAGGEVGGWMVTVIQFDYDKDGSTLQMSAIANWVTIARSRQ